MIGRPTMVSAVPVAIQVKQKHRAQGAPMKSTVNTGGMGRKPMPPTDASDGMEKVREALFELIDSDCWHLDASPAGDDLVVPRTADSWHADCRYGG